MRKEKQLLLDEMKEKLDGSSAMVLTRYDSLNPDLSADFRFALAKSGGSFLAVRKRILIKAASQSGIELDPTLLQGHIGVMFASDDPIGPTKTLFQFVKNHKDKFEVLAGQFDGAFCNAEDVKQISSLPSQDEMRAQFIGLLEAPMSQTVAVMESILTALCHCLENKSQRGESA